LWKSFWSGFLGEPTKQPNGLEKLLKVEEKAALDMISKSVSYFLKMNSYLLGWKDRDDPQLKITINPASAGDEIKHYKLKVGKGELNFTGIALGNLAQGVPKYLMILINPKNRRLTIPSAYHTICRPANSPLLPLLLLHRNHLPHLRRRTLRAGIAVPPTSSGQPAVEIHPRRRHGWRSRRRGLSIRFDATGNDAIICSHAKRRGEITTSASLNFFSLYPCGGGK
jgi:hypothetical protein